MAKVGLAFDGFVTTAEAIDMAKQAVAAGAQSLWMAEHLGYRSATGSCMAFATAAPGPLLVAQDTATVVVPPGFLATIGVFGDLIL